MKTSSSFTGWLVAAVLVASPLLACTTTTTTPGSSAGPATSSGPADPGTPGGDEEGERPHSPNAWDTCTSLASPPRVDGHYGKGMAPSPLGGSVVDGIYDVVTFDVYATTNESLSAASFVLSLAAGRFERAAADFAVSGSYETSGATLTFHKDCDCTLRGCNVDPEGDVSYAYTVTADGLVLQSPYAVSGTAVLTLKRRSP